MQACRNVRAFEPTDVPNEFATSFAPTPKAKKNPTMKPSMRIQRTSGDCASIIVAVKENIYTRYLL